MPTVLPTAAREGRVLSWPDLARFSVLIVRARWLHRRMMAADRRVQRLGMDGAGLELLAVARRWLRCHEEIAALLGRPVPPQVAQVGTILRVLNS